MKRAKIMLMAIAVLTTVGGALAFKAQKLGNTSYCFLTTAQQPADGACTNFIADKSARPMNTGEATIFYTTTTGTSCASQNLVCASIGVPDQQ
jgi:hypothetical protein